MSLECPNCYASDTQVTNTRSFGSSVPKDYQYRLTYRRRACTRCNHKFSTVEATKEVLIEFLSAPPSTITVDGVTYVKQ